jgi:predicted transcriptional regulator
MTKTATKPPTARRPATARTSANPARMVRKQLLITPEQNRRIKALAAATGRTEAYLLREAIDAKLASAGEVDWRVGFFAAVAEWPADSDIAERIAENRKAWARRHKRLIGGDGDK